MPVRNGENYLAAALESALGQSMGDLRVIISDNASEDATEEIARRFVATDARVEYHRQARNIGAAANFNFVLDRADGRYFRWSAHDDVLGPEYLRLCTERLDADRALAVCHTLTGCIDGQGDPDGTYDDELALDDPSASHRFYRTLWTDHFTEIWGLMPLAVARRAGPMQGYVGADRGYLSALVLLGRVGYVPEYQFFRRNHGSCYCRSVMTMAERRAWFAPHRRGPASRELLSKLRHYAGMISRAPIPAAEKAACARAVAAWATIRTLERTRGRQTHRPALETVRQAVGSPRGAVPGRARVLAGAAAVPAGGRLSP
ncbi:MAG: glycosyltransferase [Phycisphaerales bacterium]